MRLLRVEAFLKMLTLVRSRLNQAIKSGETVRDLIKDSVRRDVMHKLLIVLLALSLAQVATAGDEDVVPSTTVRIPLFYIAKDVNQNRVLYESVVTPDCHFQEKKPVATYWKLGNGKMEGLNFFEKKAFPIDVKVQTENTIVGDIKALKEKKVNYPITITLGNSTNGCNAVASAPGLAKVHFVYLSEFDGYEPKSITIQGLDAKGKVVDLPLMKEGESLL
jgi:hypothetical protein